MEQQKDKVTIEHDDYAATAEHRQTFIDVTNQGTAGLRANGKALLPKWPLEHEDDYTARAGTATFHNVIAKTRDVFCGLVFQKPITLGDDVPAAIEALAENIDNRGNNLDVFARDVFEDSYDGWAVILVDTPTSSAEDLGQQRSLGLRPYAVAYKASDVINWDYQINPVSRKRELSLIVLRETANARKGMFLREKVTQYRVFVLENGRVFWQLWTEKKNDKGEMEVVPETPLTLNPKLSAIPCAVIGTLGDKPPMLDLTYTNIKYAQKESDYDTIIHKTCVPIPYTTGLDPGAIDKAQVGGVMWHLPENGSINFAEVQGGSIAAARQNLEDLKVDMAWLGLQMLMPRPNGSGAATATEVVSDTIQDTSALQSRATQLKDALELMFGFMAEYMNLGTDGGGSIELGCSWQHLTLSAQELQILSTAVSDGNYSLESFLWYLEKAGKLPPDVTAEDELERIKDETATLTPVINSRQLPNETQNQNQAIPKQTNATAVSV